MSATIQSVPSVRDGLDRLRQSDFRRIAQFVEDYSGIKMPPSKVTMLEGRLRSRVRATGSASLREYCARLFEQGGLGDEAQHLIDAVTTNKTDFFREPDHFRILVQHALPTLLAERRAYDQAQVKLWSAACSTGAEPYSMAMAVAEWRAAQSGLRVFILATDLCTEVLDEARRAIYPELRRRYLLRSRERSAALVRIVPELRSWVQFRQLNLMDPDYGADRDMDAIFCRNVLIYFEKTTQRAVLERLCRHLRPGGFMFLGHSESLAGLDLPLRAVANSVFRRV
jgi:chemotaxis protein methyltransferase CheR